MKIFKLIYIIYSFLHIVLSATLAMASVEQATAQSRIRITEPMLMHEERITPLPADGSTVSERKVSFQWPTADNAPFRYRLRYSQDSHLATACTERETFWPMYNPDTDLAPGMWYWRYGYVSEDGSVKWSDINSFKVANRHQPISVHRPSVVWWRVCQIRIRAFLPLAIHGFRS